MSATKLTQTSFTAIYRRLLGGQQSDIRLHQDTFRLTSPYIPGKRVLDVGCGRGAFTKMILGQNPCELWITDYEQKHVDRVVSSLSESANGTHIVGRRLDLLSDLSGIDTPFDFINDLSVLMHLRPKDSARVILQQAQLLSPGGVMAVAVIARAVADEFYIKAPSRGDDTFYPALTGLGENPTEADVQADEMDLSPLCEYYPQDSHYSQACASTGLEVQEIDLIAGPECLKPSRNGHPCPYAPLVARKAPLWKLWLLKRAQTA